MKVIETPKAIKSGTRPEFNQWTELVKDFYVQIPEGFQNINSISESTGLGIRTTQDRIEKMFKAGDLDRIKARTEGDRMLKFYYRVKDYEKKKREAVEGQEHRRHR